MWVSIRTHGVGKYIRTHDVGYWALLPWSTLGDLGVPWPEALESAASTSS